MRRTLLTAILLSLLVVHSQGQASSSSKGANNTAASSSSVASSSSASTFGIGADCTGDGAGTDRCRNANQNNCCYYTSTQIGSGSPTVTYRCAANPGLLKSLVSDVTGGVSKLTTADSSQVNTVSYCANSILFKISAVLLSFGLASLFF